MNSFQIQTTIGKYIYEHPNTKNKDNIDIYNGWCQEYGERIFNPVFMFDLLNIIDKLKVMDRELLKELLDYDMENKYFKE